MKRKLISVIVTCYNEEENILEMYQQLRSVFKRLKNFDYEIIYVDNDSIDASEKIFAQLAKKDQQIKVLLMSRNFGSPQPSFLAGISHCQGDAAVLLHGDIQDPPDLIPKFIEKWQEGYQVVYGIRESRKGYGLLMNLLYKLFYLIIHKISYIKIPLNAGEFSLIDKRVVKELLKISEYDYYLRFLRAYVGFEQVGIKYIRDSRKHGRSSENFFSSLYWVKTLIVNFSFQPLELISKIAFLVMAFSFIFLVANFFVIFIFRDSPRGIPTIVILILFLGGIQLLALSVIAEYLAKIFLEVKGRPRYIIKKKLNFKDSSKFKT